MGLQDWDQPLICSVLQKKKKKFQRGKKPFWDFGDKEPKQFLKTCLAVVFESFCVANKTVTLEGALYCFVTYHMNSGAQPQVKCTQ